MSRFLYRLGSGSAAHPWRTIFAWVLVAISVVALSATFGGTPQDDYNVPDARAQKGVDQLREHLPEAGFASAQVVVHDESGSQARPGRARRAHRPARRHAARRCRCRRPELLRRRRHRALRRAVRRPGHRPGPDGQPDPLEDAVEPTRDAGLQVELGGEVPGSAAAPMEGYGELIGIVAALFILVLAFGSVVGAGLPIAVALTGLGVSSGAILLLAATMDVSTAAPMVATMVGLGVGIDYALLIVTRYVEYVRGGHVVADAAGRAVATAGRSVVFAAGHRAGVADGPAPVRPPGLRVLRLRHRASRSSP